MSRVANPNGPRQGGPPYASQHYNQQQQQPPHNYAQPHPGYIQQPHRPRPAPQGRVPKYTLGTARTKDGKETETLTLGDSDDDDDSTQPGPSNGGGQYHHTNGYPNGYPNGQGGAEQGRAPAKRVRNDPPTTYAHPTAGPSTTKKRKTNGNGDPYSGYEQPKQPKASVSDKEGHYIVKRDGLIYDYTRGSEMQYRISRQLGMGTFGKVVKAYGRPLGRSTEPERAVAVKVIRAVDKYREAAKVEIKVLEAINKIDENKGARYRFRYNPDSQCIHLDRHFMFEKHTCLVTELLGASVFDFLKSNSYRPFDFREIQDFARQMLDSIGCLHKNGITHTDLKPENILLVHDEAHETISASNKVVKKLKSTEIRLIDFGSATFDNEYHATVVSTRHYRAPEIILGLGWSHPCDIWSIGCILVEFFTGEALFQTHENLEHLAMMQKVFGDMPPDYAERAAAASAKANKNLKEKAWFRHNRLDFPSVRRGPLSSAEKNSVSFVNKMKKLETIILDHDDQVTAHKFLKLIKNLLMWDVRDRWTAEVALGSAFCSDEL